MRLLEQHEYPLVGGAGTSTVNIYTAPDVSITSTLEANQSTTLTFRMGNITETWNSGEWMTCSTLAGGVGFTVKTLAGNPLLGLLASTAAGFGCSSAFSSSDEDGDEFGG